MAIPRNPLNLGKIPLLITKRTNTPRPQPPLNTIQMEYMATIPKSDTQPIIIRQTRIRLIFNGGLVERITANGAGISANVPGPHGDGVPFFDFEERSRGICVGIGGVGHFDIGIFFFLFGNVDNVLDWTEIRNDIRATDGGIQLASKGDLGDLGV